MNIRALKLVLTGKLERFVKFFSQHAVRFSRRTANNILIFFLAFQLLLLVGILTGFSVALPHSAVEYVKKSANDAGLEIDFTEIRLDLKGRIRARAPKARFLGTSSNFMSADAAYVRIHLPYLLLGEVKLMEFGVWNAALTPSYGAEGDAYAIDSLTFRAAPEGDDIDLKNAHAKIGNLYLSASGRIEKSAFTDGGELFEKSLKLPQSKADKSKEDEGKKIFAKRWDEICKKISDLKPKLALIGNPAITLIFELDRREGLSVFARFHADAFSSQFGGYEFSTKALLLSARYNSADSREDLHFSLRASDLVSGAGVKADRLAFYSTVDFTRMCLEDARLTFCDVDYQGMKAEFVSAYKEELDDIENIDALELYIRQGGCTMALDLNRQKDDLKLSFDGALCVSEIMKCKLIPEIAELKRIDLRDGVYLTGEAELNLKSPAGVKAAAFLSVADLSAFGVEGKWGYSDITFDGEHGEFWARNAYVTTQEGWSIGGDVYQNINDNGYKFFLKGTLRPMAITEFMEPWWTEIFSEIEFRGKFPYVDTCVGGHWGKPEWIYSYSFIDADNLARFGATFDHFDLLVWVNPERIALMDVNVKNEGRTARADLEWVYFSKMLDNYDENRVYAVSNLNRKELIGLGGPKLEESIKMLDFEAPQVAIKLFMPSLHKYPEGKDKINIDFFEKGRTSVGKAKLDSFRFRAYMVGDDIRLDNMYFSIAKGSGFGNAFLTKKEGMDWLELDARIDGANQKDFIEFLRSLGDEAQANGETAGISEYDAYGILGGSIKLAGFSDDPASLKGTGHVNLKNEKLAEVNMLGMISKAATAIGFPLASFDLKEASSGFDIAGGVADFKDLVVTGPTARINAHARYDFINDKLDATAVMAPFASMDQSLVSSVAKLVNPLMSVLEIGMRGPVANPHISVSLRPFNIFRSDARILRNMEKRLDAKEHMPHGEPSAQPAPESSQERDGGAK